MQKDKVRPLKNTIFCLISALSSNFSPQNTQCILAAKIFARLELRQDLAFFKGLKVGMLELMDPNHSSTVKI